MLSHLHSLPTPSPSPQRLTVIPNFLELVEHAVSISADATVEQAGEMLRREGREFIGVLKDGRFLGAVSRLHIATLLGGRFGFAVFARERVAQHLLPRFQCIQNHLEFLHVIERAMAREHEEFHHDVALLDEGGRFLGMIPLKVLVHVQASLVEQQVRALEEQQRVLQERNEAIFRSTHRLRQSEGRFGILFENSALGVALLTPQGIIDLANERLVELLGSLAVGASLLTLLEPADRARFARLLSRHDETRGAADEFELSVPGRGQRRLNFHTHFIAETGQFCALVADVTEQRAMEQRLALQEKSAMLESLVGGIAHELNNKLMPVVGFAEMLLQKEEECSGPAPHSPCQIIHRSALEAAEIVQQLLQLSRPAAMDLAPHDLRLILEEALPVLRFRVRQESCTIQLDLPPEPVMVLADPAQFKQVIVNMAFNALDSMAGVADGTLRLLLQTTAAEAHLRICDQGHGIPAELRSRVFDPFFTTKAPKEGTGLGLSICQGIVKQHQGEIVLERSTTQGTVFRLSLPLHLGKPAPGPAFPFLLPSRNPVAGTSKAARIRALVVDDEEYITCVVQEALLEAMNAEVTQVASAERAIEQLQRESFDLLISDLRMPGLGGFGLHAWVRAHQPKLIERMVFITGDAGSNELNDQLETLGVAVLRKPFRLRELTEVCEKLLAGGRAD